MDVEVGRRRSGQGRRQHAVTVGDEMEAVVAVFSRAHEDDAEDKRVEHMFRSDFVRVMLGDCPYGAA